MASEREQGWWDERTETVLVTCVGGPLDGQAIPMPPGHRTALLTDARKPYYEIMRYDNTLGAALVWKSGNHAFAHHIAENSK